MARPSCRRWNRLLLYRQRHSLPTRTFLGRRAAPATRLLSSTRLPAAFRTSSIQGLQGKTGIVNPGVEDAIALALEVHHGQWYPSPERRQDPFVLHPLRVMLAVEGETERIVAVLHDVIEDTDLSLSDLRNLGYPDRVLQALDRLTRRQGETYEAYVERLLPDPIARAIKLADLKDNLTHIKDPATKWRDIRQRARTRIEEAAD